MRTAPEVNAVHVISHRSTPQFQRHLRRRAGLYAGGSRLAGGPGVRSGSVAAVSQGTAWPEVSGCPASPFAWLRKSSPGSKRWATNPDIGLIVPEFERPFLRELIHPPFRVVCRRDAKHVRIQLGAQSRPGSGPGRASAGSGIAGATAGSWKSCRNPARRGRGGPRWWLRGSRVFHRSSSGRHYSACGGADADERLLQLLPGHLQFLTRSRPRELRYSRHSTRPGARRPGRGSRPGHRSK